MQHGQANISMRSTLRACCLAIGCSIATGGCLPKVGAPVGMLRERITLPAEQMEQDAAIQSERVIASEPVATPTPQLAPLPPLPGKPAPPSVPPTPALLPAPLSAETLPVPRATESSPVDATCREPLSLEAAIEIAARNNPRLEALRARVARAEGGYDVAWADFLPEVSGALRHLNSTPNPFVLPTTASEFGSVAPEGPAQRFDRAELGVQWVLYDFGRTSNKAGQAKTAIDIARLQFQRGQETVAYDITAAYFSALQADAAIRIAEEGVATARAMQRDSMNYFRRGTVIRNDVLRADVLLADMQLQLVKARTDRGAAVATLNQVMGVNVSCEARLADRVEEPPFELSLGECLQLAADNRDEFGVVLDSIRSSQMGAGAARSDFMPRIVVGGVAVQQQTDGNADFDRLLAGGINLELALYEGGRRVGQLRQAEADIRGTIAQGKQMCDQIALEVNLAYLKVIDAKQRIVLYRTSVAQSNENLRVVRSLLAQGDAKPTELVDAVLIRTRAEQGLAQALYEYQTSLACLVYAAGIPSTPGLAASLLKGRS